jgi:hypothetical protein
MHAPIAIMSFNRPDYLRRTLESLKFQAHDAIAAHELHLFQDGAVNRWTRIRYAQQANIDACLAIFREIFPEGRVHYDGDNIGICENFCRAEDFFFAQQQAETTWFFEDDMVLSSAYFAMMEKLQAFAEQTPQLAYFSAYGDYYASEDDRLQHRRELIQLDHHWAFGLRREAWLRMQPELKDYYALVRGQDYQRRNHRAVYELFARSGMVPRGSSQDAAKTWVCARLGLARLRTFIPFARYIGRRGAHMTPEKYKELNFSSYAATRPINDLAFPNADELNRLVAEQQALLRAICTNELPEILASLPAPELNPMRLCTRDDVEAAYRLFLHREPESDVIYENHVGKRAVQEMVNGLLNSDEFRKLKDNIEADKEIETGLAPDRAMTAGDLIQAYSLLLHRLPDATAISQIETHRNSVFLKVRGICKSEEFRAFMTRSLNEEHQADPTKLGISP